MFRFHRSLVAAAVALGLGVATIAPAAADQDAPTRNQILGVAAALGAVMISSNVAHKHAVANTIQGYLPDGSTVYADGHVVATDGTSYYPGNQGQQVSCNNGSCGVSGQYGSAGSAGYNGYGYNNGYNGSGYHRGANNGYGYNQNGDDRNGYDRDGDGRNRNRNAGRNGYGNNGYGNNGYNGSNRWAWNQR